MKPLPLLALALCLLAFACSKEPPAAETHSNIPQSRIAPTAPPPPHSHLPPHRYNRSFPETPIVTTVITAFPSPVERRHERAPDRPEMPHPRCNAALQEGTNVPTVITAVLLRNLRDRTVDLRRAFGPPLIEGTKCP